MAKGIVSLLCASQALSLLAAVPVVENIRVAQDDRTVLVTVDYDLSDAPGIVTMDVLTNGVSIGAAHFNMVSGAVNRVVEPGDSHRIFWHPDETWAGNRVKDKSLQIKLKAWTLSAPPDWMLVDLRSKSNITYYVSLDALPYGSPTNSLYKRELMLMRHIRAAADTWQKGSPASASWHKAVEQLHPVALSKDYWIAIYEMTNGQYKKLTGEDHGSYFTSDQDYRPCENGCFAMLRCGTPRSTETLTATTVGTNWPAATLAEGHVVAESSKIMKMRKFTGLELDLPTEAQWEYACRAGGPCTYKYYAVGGVECTDASLLACFGRSTTKTAKPDEGGTQIVGSYKPNDWGLYDMLGNVLEMCLDRAPVVAETEAVLDPVGVSFDGSAKPKRVSKGKAFTVAAEYVSSTLYTACRDSFDETFGWNYNQGFRLVAPIGGW